MGKYKNINTHPKDHESLRIFMHRMYMDNIIDALSVVVRIAGEQMDAAERDGKMDEFRKKYVTQPAE